jgi:hypothetical protein
MKRMRFVLLCCLGLLSACAQHHGGGESGAGGGAAPSQRAPATPAQVTRAELLERLRVPLSRSDDGLRFERHGARAAQLDLKGRGQHAVMARVGRDGRVRITCVDSMAGAERALADEADAP